ncbi:MAG TPA: cytochrome P450 [Candidatus Acidoferrum sp.]|nr:cytochrome P450 [Candidatus Acidoferrum sp.]
MGFSYFVITISPMPNYPPGPEQGFFDGLRSPMRRDPLTFMTRVAREYGDIVCLRFFHIRTFLITNPDLIEDVLITNAKKFIKGRVLRANRHIFGDGLLTSEGDFWLRQRRMMQPAFHRARIANYASTMTACATRLMGSWKPGEPMDLHEEMMRLTLQVVGKTLFSADVERDAPQVGETLEVLLEFTSDFRRLVMTPKWLPTRLNREANRAVRQLTQIIDRIIQQRRESKEDAGDLLSMLLRAQDEDGSRMTTQQLRDEALTLFLAGHETTASTLSWTWWLLAQNPDVEEKLHAELDAVLNGRSPTLDHLPKLTYASCILSESMRVYPPAWAIARLAVEDHELGGYPVPKGTGIAAVPWVVHRDPRWYENPERFIPERWENGELLRKNPRFAYFPFSYGPRQCIGNTFALMEANLVLATIAQRFRFRLVPGHTVVPLASITLRPRHGLHVVAEERVVNSCSKV